MIKVSFFRTGKICLGFSVSGHAGYASCGEDIVCAGVSSAVQLTANAITEVLKIPAEVKADNDEVCLCISNQEDAEPAQPFFEALLLHLKLLAEDYKGTITFI